MEKEVMVDVRRSVLRAAAARVLDMGARTGTNLAHNAALAAEAAAVGDKAAAAAAAARAVGHSPPPSTRGWYW